jgi:hypothetical protein
LYNTAIVVILKEKNSSYHKEVLDRLAKEPVFVLSLTEGPNTGLDIFNFLETTNFKYIGFINDTDYLSEKAIESLERVLEENESVIGVTTGTFRHNSDQDRFVRVGLISGNWSFFSTLHDPNYLSGFTLFRQSALKECSFWALEEVEDLRYLLTACAAMQGPLVFNFTTFLYTMVKSISVKEASKKKILEIAHACKNCRKRLHMPELSREFTREIETSKTAVVKKSCCNTF